MITRPIDRIFSKTLDGWGMQPVVMEEGEAALVAVQAAARSGHPFDLLLLDAQMPGMDGFTLAEQLWKCTETRCPAIMMLTSADPRDDPRTRRGNLWPDAKTDHACRSARSDYARTGDRKCEKRPLPADHSQAFPGAGTPPANSAGRGQRGESSARHAKSLDKRGHTVVAVQNGREAVNAVESDSFDLALLDVQMPYLDGLQAARLIRQREREEGRNPLPLIALTAHAMSGDRERCLAAGMDGYVAKPIISQQLFAVIEALKDSPSVEEKTCDTDG